MSLSLVPRLELRASDAAKVASLVLILGERVIATQPWGRAALFLVSGTVMVIALSRRSGAAEPQASANAADPVAVKVGGSLNGIDLEAAGAKFRAGLRTLLRSTPGRS